MAEIDVHVFKMVNIKAKTMLSIALLITYYAIMIPLAGLVTGTNCQDGWVRFHNSCYWFARNHASSFTVAENYCQQHGGHLVELETKEEDLFIRDFLHGMKDDHRWIGLTDEAVEGIWKWYTSKADVTYTDWYSGEPNSYHGEEEDCAVLFYTGDYSWFDVPCTLSYEPICEIKSN